MSDFKKTLVLAFVVIVGVVITMCIFKAVEDRLSYAESFCMCFQIITTIGYGDHTPVTHAGKGFTVLVAIVGIPVNFWLLKQLGQHILNVQKLAITKMEEKLFHHVQPRFLPEKCFLIAFVLAWIIVFVGAAIQQADENWSFVHGVYCFIITLTTVGFGDLIPSHTTNAGMKIFKVLYTYFGLCIMANLLLAAFEVQESIEILKRKLCCPRFQRSHMLENEDDFVRESDLYTEQL